MSFWWRSDCTPVLTGDVEGGKQAKETALVGCGGWQVPPPAPGRDPGLIPRLQILGPFLQHSASAPKSLQINEPLRGK